jgi:hypothetical protein
MRATVLGVAVASLVLVGRLYGLQSSQPASAESQPSMGQKDSTKLAGSVTDTVGFGGRTIASGDTVQGPVVVLAGDLRVQGTIMGSAVAIVGDVLVEGSGRVTGDAIAAFGSVHASPGSVGGQLKSITGTFGSRFTVPEVQERRRQTTAGAMSLSFGWLAVMLVIGIGVLVFASNYLEGVTDVLEQSFWRSFLVGVVGELAILPALALLLLALAVTLVGILLIPFVIVAYVVAVAGLGTLGFLSVAYLTGGSLGSRRADQLQARGRALRALVVGVVLYLGMWIVAAAFQWSPLVSGMLRGLALAITYAAATAGFGAAILSRGGTRRDAAARKPATDEMAVWQTPTPVTGVVAARRPTPASTPRQRA